MASYENLHSKLPDPDGTPVQSCLNALPRRSVGLAARTGLFIASISTFNQ